MTEMVNMNSKARIAIGILIAGTALMSCRKPQGLEYVSTGGWKIQQEGFTKTHVAAEVRYFNPNKFPLRLKNADLDVYVADNFLGHYQLDSTLILPGRDTFMLPVQMTVETAKLLKVGLALLNEDVKVRVDGNIKVGRGAIFVNVPLNYEGIQKIKL